MKRPEPEKINMDLFTNSYHTSSEERKLILDKGFELTWNANENERKIKRRTTDIYDIVAKETNEEYSRLAKIKAGNDPSIIQNIQSNGFVFFEYRKDIDQCKKQLGGPENTRVCAVLYSKLHVDYIPLTLELSPNNYLSFAAPSNDSILEYFIKWYGSTKGVYPSCHQILTGFALPLMIIDLDAKKGEVKELPPIENVIKQFENGLNNFFSENLKEESQSMLKDLKFLYQTASIEGEKISLHINVHSEKYYFEDISEVHALVEAFNDYILKNSALYPSLIKNDKQTLIDIGIYKKNASLRMLGNTKSGERRPLLPLVFDDNDELKILPIDYKTMTFEELSQLFKEYSPIYNIEDCEERNCLWLEFHLKNPKILRKKMYKLDGDGFSGKLLENCPILCDNSEVIQEWVNSFPELAAMNMVVRKFDERGFITFVNGNGSRDCIYGRHHDRLGCYMRICKNEQNVWGGYFGCFSESCKQMTKDRSKQKFYPFPVGAGKEVIKNVSDLYSNIEIENEKRVNEERRKKRDENSSENSNEIRILDDIGKAFLDSYQNDEDFFIPTPDKKKKNKKKDGKINEQKKPEEEKRFYGSDDEIFSVPIAARIRKDPIKEMEKDIQSTINNDDKMKKDVESKINGEYLDKEDKEKTKETLQQLKKRFIDPHDPKSKLLVGDKLSFESFKQLFDEFDIVGLKAATGSGKTYCYRKLMILYLKIMFDAIKSGKIANPNFKIVFLSTRKFFADWLCGFLNKELINHNLQAENYQHLTHEETINLENHPILVLSIDSFYKLNIDKVKSIDMVIIDESESVVDQLNCSTMTESRACYNKLMDTCSIAKKVLVTSAHLYDRSFGLIQKIACSSPLSKPKTIHDFIKQNSVEAQAEMFRNYAEHLKKQKIGLEEYYSNQNNGHITSTKKVGIKYYTKGSFEKHTYEITSNEIQMWRKIDEAIKNHNTFIMITNSITFATRLYTYLIRYKRIDENKILLMTGKHKKDGQFENINALWPNYPFIIFTPVLTCGVSYDMLSHQIVFGYFTKGSCDAFTACQMLDRVRQFFFDKKYIYIQQNSAAENNKEKLPTTIEGIHKQFMEMEESLLKLYFDGDEKLFNNLVGYHNFTRDKDCNLVFTGRDNFYDLCLENIRVKNLSKNNLHNSMIELSKENDPKDIILLDEEEYTKKETDNHYGMMTKLQSLINEKEIKKLFESESIDFSQFQNLVRSHIKTDETWAKIDKYNLAVKYNLKLEDLENEAIIEKGYKGSKKDLHGIIRRLKTMDEMLRNPDKPRKKVIKNLVNCYKDENKKGTYIATKLQFNNEESNIRGQIDLFIIEFINKLLKTIGFQDHYDKSMLLVTDIKESFAQKVNQDKALIEALLPIRHVANTVDQENTLCGDGVFEDVTISNKFLQFVGLRMVRCGDNMKRLKLEWTAHVNDKFELVECEKVKRKRKGKQIEVSKNWRKVPKKEIPPTKPKN